MIAFAPGELATIDGPLRIQEEAQIPVTKSFDFRDMPCPPQSIMVKENHRPRCGHG